MMDTIDNEVRLIELFRQKASDRRRELVMIANERFDDDRKRKHDLKLKREQEERKLDATLATTAQLATFQQHLDDYDTAAVRGIMETRQALDVTVARREEMEQAAYRLPDGRMAFKSDDGQHVFDRRGVEVDRTVVNPHDILDTAPRWDALRKIDESEAQLTRKLDQWHSYQARVDRTREMAKNGDLTAKTLETLDADLKKSMPSDALPSSTPDRLVASKALDSSTPMVPMDWARPASSMAGPAFQ